MGEVLACHAASTLDGVREVYRVTGGGDGDDGDAPETLVVCRAARSSPLVELAQRLFENGQDGVNEDAAAAALVERTLCALGFKLRDDQKTILVELHVALPRSREGPNLTLLGRHCDNDNMGDQTTLLVYLGGWTGGGLKVYLEGSTLTVGAGLGAGVGVTGELTVATATAPGAEDCAVVVAMTGDVEHEPTAPLTGTRVCVAFHVDSKAFHL